MDEHGDIDGRIGGDVVVTLEEAVADFDVALRDHRNRRRGLGSTSAGAVDLPDSANNEAGGGTGSPLHDAGASNWLDGEATSWATVDLGVDTDPRGWCPVSDQENGAPNEAGCSIARDGTGRSLATPATPSARVPRTSPSLDDASVNDVARQPDNIKQVAHNEEVGHSTGLEPPPSPWRTERLAEGDDDAFVASGTPAVVCDPESSRSSSPPASAKVDIPSAGPGVKVAGNVASYENLPPTGPSSPLPSSPTTAERGVNAGVDSIAIEQKIAEAGHGTKKDSRIESIQATASAGRVGAATGGNEAQPNSLGSPAASPAGSVSFETGAIPKAAVGNTSASVPTSKTPEAAVPAAAVNSEAGAVAAATTSPVVAPQTSLAMECPDPVATMEQRTAGDWMEGVGSSSRQQRLPAPLAIAEAEASLAEKVDQLQSKRLAAEREEREALETSRVAKYGQERAVRAERFADEDRKTLAAEERRLAELRREADLGRLQRGAEFQEADEALGVRVPPSATTTTGATPMPVRGMRPQHFAEQEDLPEGIKKALDRPADKVLDEMEGLEARAKAAGGGMNLEVFERVEQRQRARQVERLEILHGQTADEKSATMLMMAVRLQMFARRTTAMMRVARLKRDRSASKERVRCCDSVVYGFDIAFLGLAGASLAGY